MQPAALLQADVSAGYVVWVEPPFTRLYERIGERLWLARPLPDVFDLPFASVRRCKNLMSPVEAKPSYPHLDNSSFQQIC
jgi:hypothetical protein